MSLPKSIPAKLAKLVKYWDDERTEGNDIMITTVNGYAFWPSENSNSAEHIHSAPNIKDAIRMLREVKPCNCGRCRGIE